MFPSKLTQETGETERFTELKAKFQPKVIGYTVEDLKTLVLGDKELEELLNDMLDACMRYSIAVSKVIREKSRTKGLGSEDLQLRIQNLKTVEKTMVNSINILCRNCSMKGHNSRLSYKLGARAELYGYYAVALTVSRIPEPQENQKHLSRDELKKLALEYFMEFEKELNPDVSLLGQSSRMDEIRRITVLKHDDLIKIAHEAMIQDINDQL